MAKGGLARAKGAAYERHLANTIGGRRAPFSGAIGGGDLWGTSISADFMIEAKKGKQVPWAFFGKAMKQAQDAIAVGSGKRPCVIFSPDGTSDDFIMMRLPDFMEFYERGGGDSGAVMGVLGEIRNFLDRIEEAL